MAKKEYWETPEFKEEEKIWNKKLKESGFNDIESDLDRKHRTVAKQQVTVDHERIRYFARCIEHLYSTKWENKLDRFIFDHHCRGLSNVEIAEKLKEEKLKSIDQSNVYRRLLKILKKANIEPISFNF